MNLIAYHLIKQKSFKKSLILRLFLLSISCIGSCFINAQDLEGLDSLLVDRDIENYSIRVFTNYKVNKFTLENSGSKLKFVPNNKHGLGIGFANKKMILDIAFNLKNPNKEDTRRFDLQGTTIVKNRHFVNLYVQSYKGFESKNNYGDPSIFRKDLRSVSFGFNYLYTLGNVEFSYSLLKAGLDEKNHKDIFVTGGIGAFSIFDYFSSDASILSEDARIYFNEHADVKRYQGIAFGVLAGVISYIKLPENVTATVNFTPGIGVMSKKLKLEDSSYKPSNPMLYKLDFSLGLAYNLNRYYICLTYSNGLYNTSFGNNNNYRLNLSKAKLAIGYKLGSAKNVKPKQSLF